MKTRKPLGYFEHCIKYHKKSKANAILSTLLVMNRKIDIDQFLHAMEFYGVPASADEALEAFEYAIEKGYARKYFESRTTIEPKPLTYDTMSWDARNRDIEAAYAFLLEEPIYAQFRKGEVVFIFQKDRTIKVQDGRVDIEKHQTTTGPTYSLFNWELARGEKETIKHRVKSTINYLQNIIEEL